MSAMSTQHQNKTCVGSTSLELMFQCNLSTTLLQETITTSTSTTTTPKIMTLPVDPISAETSLLILKVTIAAYLSVSIMGIVTNLINIGTFLRAKLDDSVTILLFFLAISDFGVCSFEFIGTLASIVEVVTSERGIEFFIPPDLVSTYISGVKRVFSDTTVFITTFLAVQRCICVVLPFEVKNLFNVARTYCFIVVCFSYTVTVNCLLMSSFRLATYFNPATNRTVRFFQVRPEAEPLVFYSEVVQSMFLNAGCPVLTLVCVLVMGVALMRSAKFKSTATASVATSAGGASGTGGNDKRIDKKTSKERQALLQVTLITSIFVVTNIPYLPYAIVSFLIPEFFRWKAYDRLYRVVQWALLLGELINSSVNFFVYRKFNSKFKENMPFSRKSQQK